MTEHIYKTTACVILENVEDVVWDQDTKEVTIRIPTRCLVERELEVIRELFPHHLDKVFDMLKIETLLYSVKPDKPEGF